ncbi:MAG: sulfatase-like hydrolase/transferase [Myxococcales bacterium]|nr:sulfatase-like hydrolase/transferase [Myxococcales bacterium]
MSWQHQGKRAVAAMFRGMFLARRAQARRRKKPPAEPVPSSPRTSEQAGDSPRNILFITVDQQRFDALGVNGGAVARTPTLDRLAAEGINYERAHVQSVVCMPSRSTMLTGQHPWTHGVVANGISLPSDAPSVAELLRTEAGYRTALIGKAHFDPHLDPTLQHFENRVAAQGQDGPWHGFEHLELATHGPMVGHHYAAWLWQHHPEAIDGFGGVLTGEGGGDTGAPEVGHNPVKREQYHTDWVADRTIAWLGTLPRTAPFFCWMSFPDPHHPLDPPHEEVKARIDWRALDLPAGHPGTPGAIRAILVEKPQHWLDWYEGRYKNPEGGPVLFDPQAFTHDQVREVNAMIHVENELIDEACQRVFDALEASGQLDHTDIFYTSDHGELQGDFGLMFKGPYHVESLLRVPLIWRPAPAAQSTFEQTPVSTPVGHIDLAPTFCRIAGVPVPGWMEGTVLPMSSSDAAGKSVITTFDSQFAAVGMHLQTIYQDGLLCTVYGKSTRDEGGRFPIYWRIWGAGSTPPDYAGTEGELYDVRADPHQHHNLWNDPAWRERRDSLVAALGAALPTKRSPALPVAAPT